MDKLKELYGEDWSMKDKVLMTVTALLTGFTIGILISPIKGGIHLLSDNASNNTGCEEDEKEEKKKKLNKKAEKSE